MQLPEELRSPRTVSLVLGVVGSVLSLSFMKDVSTGQKVAIVIAGSVCASLFAQPIIDLVHAPGGWANGISFLVGTLGWTVLGALVALIRKADLWSLASEIIRSWLERR